MGKGLFITGTGTDIGKTYVTALLAKKLKDSGLSVGYYKAALSGADSIKNSDAGYVKQIAGLEEDDELLLSYLYKNAVSPHLAARWEGRPIDKEVIQEGYKKVAARYDYVLMEGSGGIVCPIRIDDTQDLYLTDLIKMLGLSVLIVAEAGLGTINAVVTTVAYARSLGIEVKGVILNHWLGNPMEVDNALMITKMTGVPIAAKVSQGATELSADIEVLKVMFE